MDKNRCKFSILLKNRGDARFECPDEQSSDGYCKFHHPTYAASDNNKADLMKLLEQKIQEANESGSALVLIGYKFPRELSISNQFKSTVQLDNAEFLGNTHFEDSIFKKDVSLSGATFHGNVRFHETTFEEKANFAKSEFKGTATFHEVVTFHGGADFSNATFSSEVLFYEVDFGDSSFSNAIFHEGARFTETSFNGEATFHETTFHGDVRFDEGSFYRVEFIETTFNRKVQFSSDVTFHGGADFSNATFKGDVSFSCTFESYVSSHNATYNGEASFDGATFNEGASFDRSKFNGILSFTDNTINKGTVSFANVFFKEKDHVIFSRDLSQVSFVSTDITRAQFRDIVWGRKGTNQTISANSEPDEGNSIHDREQSDFKIHDERRIEKSVNSPDEYIIDLSLETVIAEYRNLRENYEYYLRYEEAGKFFIREMELKRKYRQSSASERIKKNGIISQIFSFATWYKILANYGEEPRIPLVIAIGAFAIGTVCFLHLQASSMDKTVYDILTTNGTAVSESMRKTTEAFFPFFSLPADSGWLGTTLKATMVPIVGLLFITLRRKLERRFRH